MRLGSTDASSDPPGSSTRQAAGEGFGPGFNAPLLLTSKLGAPADRAAVARVVTSVSRQPGVAKVSPPQFLNGPAGQVVTLEAFPTTSPHASATTNLIQHLRSDTISKAEAGSSLHIYIGGSTATFADFARVVGSKMSLFVTVVVLLSVLLLALVFRSIVIPLTAAVMNLSAGAALGALSAAWDGEVPRSVPAGPPDHAVPPHHDLRHPVRPVHGLPGVPGHPDPGGVAADPGQQGSRAARAGHHRPHHHRGRRDHDPRVRLVHPRQRSHHQAFGLGLAVAVLVDASVIRMGIVPATMFLLRRSNWWFPARLDRVLPSLGAESLDEPPVHQAEPADV
jgi:RND superfamily putative drug exporter